MTFLEFYVIGWGQRWRGGEKNWDNSVNIRTLASIS